ncbi:hypothetical protein [Micromonospora sp. NPDC005220]|uniref:hypothetical protein n=1 Tax=Micromonospora sp. NPDC005220 TaxID=3155589 RepID=UPI0033B2FB66
MTSIVRYVKIDVTTAGREGGRDACVCTSIVTGSTLRDLQCSSGPDVWSLGANTLSVCTRALGGISDVAQKETEVRC